MAFPSWYAGNPSRTPPPGPPVPSTGSEVWAKPMSDDRRVAVLLLNLHDENSSSLTVTAEMLNLSYSAMAIHDVWAQKDLGTFHGSYTAKAVPPHGTVVVTVSDAVVAGLI